MGEVETRSVLKGIRSFKPTSEYMPLLELKRGWFLASHRWPLGWSHDKLRLLPLIRESQSIESYYFLPAADFMPFLDILVVITLVSQSIFQKSDQMLRRQVWLEESLAKHQVMEREEGGEECRLAWSSHMESGFILGSWKMSGAHKMLITGWCFR